MRSQLMMMMMMMMRVILSMNNGRADRCSHFRCRKTCTHACIYIYDKHTCQFGRSSNVQFLVGIHFFNSFSLLSISLSISISPSLYISLSFSLSISYFFAYFQPVPKCFCTCVHVLLSFCPLAQTGLGAPPCLPLRTLNECACKWQQINTHSCKDVYLQTSLVLYER